MSFWVERIGVEEPRCHRSPILIFFSNEQQPREFVEWGLGSFSRVRWGEMPFMSAAICLAFTVAVLTTKPLNALLLGENYGQIEHGVEMSDGEQIFPETRHLPADAEVDEWVESSAVLVEVDEEEEEGIGKIRSRRLEDGRVEVGYVTVSGREVEPRVRYLPSEMPVGVWFRSGNVTAPRGDGS